MPIVFRDLYIFSSSAFDMLEKVILVFDDQCSPCSEAVQSAVTQTFTIDFSQRLGKRLL